MNIWKRVRNLLGGEKVAPPTRLPVPMAEEEPEIVVPEITVEQLAAALASTEPPLVIDVREPYEWQLARMTAARHLPMNDVPNQLDTLPRDPRIGHHVRAWQPLL